MILVLCGTSEGRQFLWELEAIGPKVVATVTTTHGMECLRESNVEILTGKLTEESLSKLIEDRSIKYIIDITHPYAENISLLAIRISKEKKLHYLRYERQATEIPEDETVIRAESYKEAAEIAGNHEGRVFLTVGSNQLPIFSHAIKLENLIARVLPTSEVIQKCEELGFTADNIIAMKGPFSTEINKEMFLMYKAAIVVTKDSGAAGGTIEKVEACRQLGIPIIIVDRPQIEYPNQYESLEELLIKLKGMIKH